MNTKPPCPSDLVNKLSSQIKLDLSATACPKPGCTPASEFSRSSTNEAKATHSVPLGTN